MSDMAAQLACKPEQDRAETDTIERYFAAIQAGDYADLSEVLTADAITQWPQSGERIVGAASCIKVYQDYPGGSPEVHLQRVTGEGAAWVAESTVDYGDSRWHVISIFEFDGARIAGITDYFGPSLPAPEWRRQWVQIELGPIPADRDAPKGRRS